MLKLAKVDPVRCKGCGLCEAACPKKAIHAGHELNAAGYHYMVVKEEDCIGCGICYISCPDYAISVTEGGRQNG
ncbi:MAG: 4Fe-4S binding protein [Firmicutes bacterium]|nr:4Fe-4S binding protein [Bacillota bacterium]MCR4711570.1 4Fe-4S binding protein [Clostridia bacterium]